MNAPTQQAGTKNESRRAIGAWTRFHVLVAVLCLNLWLISYMQVTNVGKLADRADWPPLAPGYRFEIANVTVSVGLTAGYLTIDHAPTQVPNGLQVLRWPPRPAFRVLMWLFVM